MEGSNKLAFGILVIIVVFIAGFIVITSKKNSQDKKVVLSARDILVVLDIRVASTQNALDGKGKFTEKECNQLKDIAKEFDSSADFISSCKYTDSLYLDTPDTSDRKVLTISDDSYTAKFSLDNDQNTLLDYTFIDKPSSGFNIFGGRK